MKRVKVSTKPNLVKSEDIHTLDFKLIYPIRNTNECDLLCAFLSHLLCESTALIPDETEFQREKLRKTVLEYSFYTNQLAKCIYLTISFSLPQENLIPDYDLEESFKFIVDCIKNPIFKDKAKAQEQFDHAKEYFLKKYEAANQEIYGANEIVFRNIMDPDERIEFSHASYGKFLKSLTIDDIYNFYKDNILNNTFVSYVLGNIEEEKVNYLFDKYLHQDVEEIEYDTEYVDFFSVGEYKEHVIETKFNQAQLIMEYQAENLTEDERIKLSAVINILNAQENNLIFNSLRVQNGLVYDTYVRGFTAYGLFTVEAFIDSKNKDKVVNLVKETLELLTNVDNVKTYYEKLVKGYKMDLLKQEDSLYKDLNKKINDDFNIRTVRSDYEKLLQITPEDIVDFMDRIKLTNVIIFKEDKHD